MGEKDLIQAAIRELRTHGLEARLHGPEGRARRGRNVDGWLQLARGKTRLAYALEAKHAVTAATLGAVIAQLAQIQAHAQKPALLVTEHVAPLMAERLKELGWQFVDAAGNAFVDAPGLYLWVIGRRPLKATLPQVGRAFTRAGVKALFAMLCEPELGAAPMRRLAEAADVALGAIPIILTDLERRGDLVRAGRNRRLLFTKRLLDEWAIAYARALRPKTLTRVLATPAIERWEKWNLGGEARWGGEPAARLVVGHLTPGVLTIYAKTPPPPLIVEHRLKDAGLGALGNVEIRAPFWAAELKTEREDVVPNVLIYADLLAVGDARCIETAGLLYEKRLARLFPAN